MALPPVHTEQRFSIRPTYVVSTPVYSGFNSVRSKEQRLSESNLLDNSHQGQLSLKASKKIRNAINWLTHSAKFKRVYSKVDQKHYWFKVNFITLTIPYSEGQEISGERVHKLLHTFIAYSRKYFYLHNYVWKIERGRQNKLHIHLTTDTFIHYRRLRDCWNRILLKDGLIDNYFKQHGHYDPNSTDVHAVRKVKNLAGYMAEYMCKGTGLGEDFKNRIWGCNYNLSDRNKCSYISDAGELSDISKTLFHTAVRWRKLESKPDSMGRIRSYGEIFFLNESIWSKVIHGRLKDVYTIHINAIRDATPKPPAEYLMFGEVKSTLPTIERKLPEIKIEKLITLANEERRYCQAEIIYN